MKRKSRNEFFFILKIGGCYMPIKPFKLCEFPRCIELVEGTYCNNHKPKKYDGKRLSARERGYDIRWRKARLTFLKMLQPDYQKKY